MQFEANYTFLLGRVIEFIIFLFCNQQCDEEGAREDDEEGHGDHQELLQPAPALPEAGGPHPVAEGRGDKAHCHGLVAQHLSDR